MTRDNNNAFIAGLIADWLAANVDLGLAPAGERWRGYR